MHKISIFLAVLAQLMSQAAVAQDQGDPKAGLTFAREVCATCHAVEVNDRTSPTPDAPSFTDVAELPSTTPLSLKVWLQTSHPTMPNLILSEQQKADVIAYIVSLGQQHQ